MKRNNSATTAIALVLFLTFLAYAGVYAFRFVRGGAVTAEAVSATVSIGGIASGIIVREESVLESGEQYIDIIAAEGEKIGVGQAVALAMSSETGLQRANRTRELRLEIERAENALRTSANQDDLIRRSELLRSAVLNLSASAARHELSSLDKCIADMRALAFRNEASPYTQAELDALKLELASLESSKSADSVTVLSEKSGIFSRNVDGYEHLSLISLAGLSPTSLQRLIDSQREVSEQTFGKLVTNHKWYFAAVMNTADIRGLHVGQAAQLDFGRYYGSTVASTISYISPTVSGEVAVIFECTTALGELLSLREASANVVFEQYEGIRVPTSAIYTDEETGATFVWAITAMRLERKDVAVKYLEDGFCIVESSSDESALRVGDTIVAAGRDLYEGKVMG